MSEKLESRLKFISGCLIVQILLLAVIAYTINGMGTGGSGAAVAPSAGAPSAPSAPPPKIDMKELVDDDPFMGDEDAPVTIIEFSDYECPFCRRFWTDTLPQIKSEYIDTGKVKLVYRDFPLSFHPGAKPAAEAAECAQEQGGDSLYFAFHDVIFEEQGKQGQGTIQFGVAEVKQWAKKVGGLDYAKWEACFDSGKMASEVQKDFRDGSAVGIRGTPGFIINGKPLSGAQPFSVFQQIIEAELN